MLGLLVLAVVYGRGWRVLRRQMPDRFPVWRLASFLASLATLLVAVASPLEAFAGLLLQVHMLQHLLLMMVAPPLLLLGRSCRCCAGCRRGWRRSGSDPPAQPGQRGVLQPVSPLASS